MATALAPGAHGAAAEVPVIALSDSDNDEPIAAGKVGRLPVVNVTLLAVGLGACSAPGAAL